MQLRTLSAAFVGVLLLSGCNASQKGERMQHTMSQDSAASARPLSLFDETDLKSGKLAFTIFSGEDIFTDYGVSHTKKMHLIVVRDDLRSFSHLHPTMNGKGAWVVPFTAPAGGKYWLYADFVEGNGAAHTIRFEQTYPGASGESGLVKESKVREKTVDGFHVKLETEKNDHGLTFQYTVTDANGKPVALEPYLGALGHSVLINPSGGYIHTHPDDSSDELIFTVPGDLKADFYRIFTQFKVAGKVHTVSFDWEP